MECAYYIASWNGIAVKRLGRAFGVGYGFVYLPRFYV